MSLQTYMQKHPIFTHSEAINALCKPLFDLGLTYFSHAHIDEHQKLTALSTCPRFSKTYFEKNYHLFGLHQLPSTEEENDYLWDVLPQTQQSLEVESDFNSFGYGHGFSIVFNHAKGRDCYHFATAFGNNEMNGRYLQLLDVLKRFICIYKDKLAQHKDFKIAYDIPIHVDHAQGNYLFKPNELSEYESNTILTETLQRIYINGSDAYLTQREFECLQWISQGKTAHEIATSLGITERTIKAHVRNMKQKLDCHNQFQLGMAYAKLVSFRGFVD